jgi:hypothetical protein
MAAPTAALPLGTSIFDHFPLVEAATILEITQHNFKPMDLFKLDPAAQDKNLEKKATLEVEGGILTMTPCSGLLHDYLTLSSLLEPLLTYFSIPTAYAALSGDMLATLTIMNGYNAYTGHFLTLSQQFQWSTVLLYHKSYFLSHHHEMAMGDYLGWSQPDILLMTEHVYSHPHIQNHPSCQELVIKLFKTAHDSSDMLCIQQRSVAICHHVLITVSTSVRSAKGQIMVHQAVANYLKALAGQASCCLVLIWLALASHKLWF